MVLPDPQLDDRHFQDLVNEAKQLIPRYTPEWTDHNVSDPGVTLIELFAWMTDLLLYRLNRVPEKNYVRFMDMIGIQLKDALPARARLTFELSAVQPGPVTIPRGTEVSTLPVGERDAISFTTDEDLVIWPPTLRHCLFSSDGLAFTDYFGRLDVDGEFFDAFQKVPMPGDALYFGFAENLGSHLLTMSLVCTLEGIGVDPKDPPLAWEAWCGDVRGWTRCHLERDTTGGLNQPGRADLLLPPGMETLTLARRTGHWLRLRVLQPRPRQPTYSASPRIDAVSAEAFGGEAEASHSELVVGEYLGRAGGVPGESFTLREKPVLARRPDEYIEIEGEPGDWTPWTEVETFADSLPDDRHYRLDPNSGTVSFGPMIRTQAGAERAYGATPAKGSAIRMTRYRRGGGISGNVGANTLTTLRSAIPYIARVTNREAARGGLDPETLDAAKFRAPMALSSQNRAITTADYEFLAKEASRRVARAKCIQVRGDGSGSAVPPGTVELLIVPVLPPGHARTLQTLQPAPELLESVRRYIDERRLLGTHLAVDGPAFVGVSVEANVIGEPYVSMETVRQNVLDAITGYLDPLDGGPDGTGWPFGRDLYLSEIQSVIQSVDGVRFAQDVTLYQVDLQTGQSRAAGQKITIAEDVLLLSFEHNVTATLRSVR